MSKKVIFSLLFSAAATVASFAQQTETAPAPKMEKETGLGRPDKQTADKPGQGNEAIKRNAQKKMQKEQGKAPKGERQGRGAKGKGQGKGHAKGQKNSENEMEKSPKTGGQSPAPNRKKAPKTTPVKPAKEAPKSADPATRGGSQK